MQLTPLILENMAVLLRRLSDDKVDDQLQDLLVMCIKSDDIHTQVGFSMALLCDPRCFVVEVAEIFDLTGRFAAIFLFFFS